MEQTYQARRWLSEVDANFAGPMLRAVDGQDYYVHEPALACMLSGRIEPVVPTRWFIRDGEYWAKAHPLITSHDSLTLDINGSICLELPLTEFRVSMERLEHYYGYHKLPPPHQLKSK